MFFSEKILEFYNALCGTSYINENKREVVSLEEVTRDFPDIFPDISK